jgi:hypothetical protein
MLTNIPTLSIKIDDVIVFNNEPNRVMSVSRTHDVNISFYSLTTSMSGWKEFPTDSTVCKVDLSERRVPIVYSNPRKRVIEVWNDERTWSGQIFGGF